MFLPTDVNDITAEWLSEALSVRTPGIKVDHLNIGKIIHGTTAKVLMTATYAEELEGGPPTGLCLKAGFDDALRPLVSEGYIGEAHFFNHIAPQIDAALPRCWFADADEVRRQGIIILDDLTQSGVTFGDPLTPWSVDVVAKGLEQQAAWHAQTWNAKPEDYPSLHVGSWIRKPAEMLFSESNWQRAMSDEALAALIPSALQDREQVEAAINRMWAIDDAEGIPSLSHSDPHVGNSYVDAQGTPCFIDWQSGSLAPSMDDVAYFMVGSLTVEDRRKNEDDLLRHYIDVLSSRLGQNLDYGAAYEDYRRHCMHGMVWAMVPPPMQPVEAARAMTERYVAAIMDTDSLGSLKL